MSHPPPDPPDEREQRDESLAARLAVEPLDDVTRTRLVRAAMDAAVPEAPPSAGRAPRSRSRRRWLSAAAAVVVVLAVGIAVLTRHDSGSGPTAARVTPGSAVPNDGVETQQLSVLGGVRALGDLGDVGRATTLRRAVAAAATAAPSSAAKGADEAAGATTALPRAAIPTCTPSLPGDVVAVGTGTAHGKPVTVYVVEHKDGSRAAVVVRDNCAIGEEVPL
jgi:hypothetical protein